MREKQRSGTPPIPVSPPRGRPGSANEPPSSKTPPSKPTYTSPPRTAAGQRSSGESVKLSPRVSFVAADAEVMQEERRAVASVQEQGRERAISTSTSLQSLMSAHTVASKLSRRGRPDGVKLAMDLLTQEGADPNAEAMAKFKELDADGSGFLDRQEVSELLRTSGVTKRRAVKKAIKTLDPDGDEKVTFMEFVSYWNWHKEEQWRLLRRKVKDDFVRSSSGKRGTIGKEAFGKIASKALAASNASPPFDLENDWNTCIRQSMDPSRESAKQNSPRSNNKKRRQSLAGDVMADHEDHTLLTYLKFERWWKERIGVQTPDIPVLPEYMVQVVGDAARLTRKQQSASPKQTDVSLSPSSYPMAEGGARAAGEGAGAPTVTPTLVTAGRWDDLSERLRLLVRMQKQWGNLHDIYDAHSESRYTLTGLPRWIRDPDSGFSACWDLISVVLLMYVSIVVPLRACFELELVELWSSTFFIDLFVDLFFIIDVYMNFRTAYYLSDGTREARKGLIARQYLRGWFAIDFASCLPVGYIAYLFPAAESICVDCSAAEMAEGFDDNDASSANFKAIKALRLVRLSKMLRLARIKKILTKYGGDVNLQMYVSVGFTFFVIFFLVHILCCIFYLLGNSNQTLPNGVEITGWVNAMALPTTQGGFAWDASISLGTRYVTSTYLVMNAIENSNTDAEKAFALVSEFARDFILGLLAGIITTVSMAVNSFGEGSQDGQLRLRDLKNWMSKKNLPKALQIPILQYCNEVWTNRSGLNVNEFFSDVPPSMRMKLLSYLYGSVIARNPLFRGLANEVVSTLCQKAKALYVMPNQKIINEGEPGKEMYMVISGELEVTQNQQRLGFLGEGSFFGEAAVLCSAYKNDRRTRTVTAVIDSELCYLTYEDLQELQEEYPELKARLARFSNVGQMRLTTKNTRKLFGSSAALQQMTSSTDYLSDATAPAAAAPAATSSRSHTPPRRADSILLKSIKKGTSLKSIKKGTSQQFQIVVDGLHALPKGEAAAICAGFLADFHR